MPVVIPGLEAQTTTVVVSTGVAGAFPEATLDVAVEAAFGADLTAAPSTWRWTNLTARLTHDPITIRRGTTAGGSNQQATTGQGITLLNSDGALTPHHAGSPYWPYVDAGTPVRVGARTTATAQYYDTFVQATGGSGGWFASDSGHTYQFGNGITNYSTSGGKARINMPAVDIPYRAIASYITRDVDVTFDVSVPAMPAGAGVLAGVLLRYQDSSNYLQPVLVFGVNGIVGVRILCRAGGALSNAGSATTGLPFTAGQVWSCRVEAVRDRIRVRAWPAAGAEPQVWHTDVAVSAFPEAAAFAMLPGRSGPVVYAQGGMTNLPMVVSFDNIFARLAYAPRLEGYLTDVQPTFEPQTDGTTWSTVQLEVGGVGSRLEKNEAPAESPMRRAVRTAVSPIASAAPPVAYWPLEDAEGSLSAASAFAGQPPMTVTGPAVFGFSQSTPEDLYQATYGTKPLVSLAAGARLSGTVPTSTVSSQWSVAFEAQFYVPQVTGYSEIRIAEWATPTGTWTRWAWCATNTGYILRAYNDDTGTATVVASTATGAFSALMVYEIDAVQSGGNISVQVLVSSGPFTSGTVAGTVGPVTRLVLNPDRANTTNSVTPAGLRFIVGHARVYDATSATGIPYYYDNDQGATPALIWAHSGWLREAAHRRVARLCLEESVPCQVLGSPYLTGSTVLNSQREGAFKELLDHAVESESGGLLWEAGFGYRYLPRTARYNQLPALTIDMGTYRRSAGTGQGDVLVPRLESRAANYWTLKRHLGSEGSAAALAEYRRRRGTIGEERTVDVLTDDMLAEHATWRVWTSTGGRDAHYPSIPLDLAANPQYIAAWLDTDIGSRVWRTNQPAIAGSGVIDQVVEGWTETLSPTAWSVELDATPGGVWDVWSPDDPVLGWVSPAGAKLQSAVSSSATTLVVAVTGPPFTTDPGSYPVDLDVEGERIRVNSPPIGSVSPQAFAGAVRSVNGIVKAHGVNAPVELWSAPVIGL